MGCFPGPYLAKYKRHTYSVLLNTSYDEAMVFNAWILLLSLRKYDFNVAKTDKMKNAKVHLQSPFEDLWSEK